MFYEFFNDFVLSPSIICARPLGFVCLGMLGGQRRQRWSCAAFLCGFVGFRTGAFVAPRFLNKNELRGLTFNLSILRAICSRVLEVVVLYSRSPWLMRVPQRTPDSGVGEVPYQHLLEKGVEVGSVKPQGVHPCSSTLHLALRKHRLAF